MAYTLDNLRTDIRNYTEVGSNVLSDSVLERIIKNAELKIHRAIDTDQSVFYATSNLIIGNRYVTIPADLRFIRYVQLKNSDGEQFFLEQRDTSFKASFQEFSKKDTILFDIGTGEMEQYIKKGKLTFSINNVNLSLTAFQGNGSNVNRIFIPFADLTSGVSTYGSGRYLYSVVKDGKADLDFNYASNPYCAYNEEYVCFPAPDENILDVKIEIGEKLYH